MTRRAASPPRHGPADRQPANLAADAPNAVTRLTRAYPGLTGSGRQLADYVLAHRFETATLSIDLLARAARVSVASANRFARALGYPGYAAMREDWQRELRPEHSALEKLLRHQETQSAVSTPALMSHVLADARDALARAGGDLDASACEAFAGRLARAGRVAVFGADTSAYLGGYAASLLSYFRGGVDALSTAGGPTEPFRRLTGYGAPDVLWVLSLPRYSSVTIELAGFAAQRGIAVMAITDSPSAPVTAIAQTCLFAPTPQAVLPASGVATLALIEAVCSVIAHRNQEMLGTLEVLSTTLAHHFTDPAGPAVRTAASKANRPGRGRG